MNADLKAAVKINSLAGKVRPFDLMMDLITRYGHWAFVIYGLLLWFTPGKTREDRRNACVSAFIGVCIASLISYAIGRVWKRERPFRESPQIWNFTGHRANASFPSNHTMNGCVVAMELLRHNTKGSKLMAVLAGILAFSRVFAGMHYPSDVLGGMIVGLIAAAIAYAITLLIYRIVSAHPDNRFCRFVLHGGIGRKKERQAA